MGELVEQERITIWYSVPFALIQLLQRGAMDQRNLRSVRLVLFGGEPISCKHLRKLMDLITSAKFCNLYGPAETNNCTSYFLPPDLNGDESEIPIGKPLVGVHIQIESVDEPSHDDPAVGELWVKSPTMMKGYWGKPEINASVFKEFDGPGNSGGTYYNTGDLVSYRQDGELMFHGRKDRLIKIRGNRIELDEIEAVVCQYPSIVECAAFVVDRHQDQERVESCIRTEQNEPVDIPDLLKFVSGKLPRYAIPNNMTQVESYPRTTSGKIDRVALQAAAESGYAEYRSI